MEGLEEEQELFEQRPPIFGTAPEVHCEACTGGCGCGYDSSSGGWCPCENECECPTCSPERKSQYTLYYHDDPPRVTRKKVQGKKDAGKEED